MEVAAAGHRELAAATLEAPEEVLMDKTASLRTMVKRICEAEVARSRPVALAAPVVMG